MKKLLSTFIIAITFAFSSLANAALVVTNNPSNPFMFPGVGGRLH